MGKTLIYKNSKLIFLPIYLIFLFIPIINLDIFYIFKFINERNISVFTGIIYNFIFLLFFIVKIKFFNNDSFLQNSYYFITNFFHIVYLKVLYFNKKIIYSGNEWEIFSSLLLFAITIYYLKYNYSDKLLILQILFFYSIFNIGLFGIIIIYLYFEHKLKFYFSKTERNIFSFLPILNFILYFVSSLSPYFNNLWMSLIRKPFAGFSRFYDLQKVLIQIQCNTEGFKGRRIFFNPGFAECEGSYSPVYNLISLSFNHELLTYIIAFLFLLLLTYIYLLLIKKFNDKYEFIVLLFLSPPINFLIYQGNLDLITLIFVTLIFIDFNKNKSLKIFLLLFISLLEIHTVAIFFGLILYSLLKKNFNIFFKYLISLIVFFLLLFFDFRSNKFSYSFLVDSWSNITLNTISSSFGLKLDLMRFLPINDNFFWSVLILSILFITVIIYRNSNSKLFFSNNLDIEMFFGLSFWFFVTVFYENPIYRLANFILLFIFLLNSEKKLHKYFILFAFFLNPTPAYDILLGYEFRLLNFFEPFADLWIFSKSLYNIIDYVLIIVNRVGIYGVFLILLRELIVNIKKEVNK